jgi:hypothetical protein
MTQETSTTAARSNGIRGAEAKTLWMLNCYDLWSATPRAAEECDCPGSSSAGAADGSTLGDT